MEKTGYEAKLKELNDYLFYRFKNKHLILKNKNFAAEDTAFILNENKLSVPDKFIKKLNKKLFALKGEEGRLSYYLDESFCKFFSVNSDELSAHEIITGIKDDEKVENNAKKTKLDTVKLFQDILGETNKINKPVLENIKSFNFIPRDSNKINKPALENIKSFKFIPRDSNKINKSVIENKPVIDEKDNLAAHDIITG